MTCRACVWLLLDVDEVYAIICTQILKTPNFLLAHVLDLNNNIKPDIGTLKKYRGGVFSEWLTKSFKAKFLNYVN